jgi:hypothetical protein
VVTVPEVYRCATSVRTGARDGRVEVEICIKTKIMDTAKTVLPAKSNGTC